MQRNILIVDSDAGVCRLLGRFAELSDYTYIVAHTATEGRRILLHRQDIGLVVCDWMLPDDNGTLTVLRMSKSMQFERPVIVMSGYHDLATQLEGAGATAFLPKPFTLEAFQEILETYLPLKTPATKT